VPSVVGLPIEAAKAILTSKLLNYRIPTGHTGHVETLGVTAEEFAYFDPTDGGTYVDLRVK